MNTGKVPQQLPPTTPVHQKNEVTDRSSREAIMKEVNDDLDALEKEIRAAIARSASKPVS